MINVLMITKTPGGSSFI